MEEVDEIAADTDCECDEVLDAAITYKTDGTTYPSNSSKDSYRKQAIRKRAERLEIVKGEIFFVKKNGKQRVKIITEPKEQKRYSGSLSLRCNFRAFWRHQDL